MADAYGPRFLRDFGDAPPQIWASAITSLKDHEIARGMRRLLMHGSASSPTLPQFVKACKAIGDDEGMLRPANTYQALPKPQRHENRFLMIGNFELLKFLLKHDVDFKFMDSFHAVRLRASKDYFEIDKEDPVNDEEFRQYMRKEFLKILPDVKESEALKKLA